MRLGSYILKFNMGVFKMRTTESNIRTETVFKDDNHRLLLKKIWNEDLPSTAILMSNAGITPNEFFMDYTTMFCINSLSMLGYGSCSIVNLFSKQTTKLQLTENLNDLTCPENEEYIIKAFEEASIGILAVGSITSTYKKVGVYLQPLYDNLRPYQDKIHVIEDSLGTQSLHPLARTLRGKPWTLVPYKLPLDEKKDKDAQPETEKQAEPRKTDKNKRSIKK